MAIYSGIKQIDVDRDEGDTGQAREEADSGTVTFRAPDDKLITT